MSRKFWMFVMVLLTLTALYPLAILMSVQKYEAWKQAQLEVLPASKGKYIDFYPHGRETYLLLFVWSDLSDLLDSAVLDMG